MKLIVGLGNPGKKYEATRHNAGWRVIDAVRERLGLPAWSANFRGQFSKGRAEGRDIALLKPETFMNLSGESVFEAAQFYKIDPRIELWVVHDDLDLPFDSLRLSIGAGAGGHNGVQSVIERLGRQDFARFRVGIGRPIDRTPIDDYVLQSFREEEEARAAGAEERAALAVLAALKEGLTAAMNEYNG